MPRYRILDESYRTTITETGMYMLRFRYLKRSHDGGYEDPVALFRRVAWNLAEAERIFEPGLDEDRVTEWADAFFRLMTDFRFLPNAPTLLGAGRPLQQLCACFVLPVGDSIDEVFDALRMAAVVHARGGGTGFSFHGVRPRGASISTGGAATGVVPFLRLFDHETELIKAGGTGWGANMGVLPWHHPDIREFVTSKTDRNSLRNFNLSVGITDAFVDRLRAGEEVELVDPRAGEAAGRLWAGELFDLICRQAWATGDPGLLFLDRIERDNPTPDLGPLSATNPCGEAPLLPFESCCLGGLNVAAFHDPETNSVRWGDLREAAALALRMMDNVIEASRYPLPEIEEATRRTRKVGIGMMGLGDLLIAMEIPYDSPEAEALAGDLMREIASATREASIALAGERGSFPAFSTSRWARMGIPRLRNATTTSNAPNSTIGAIAGTSAGIEPLFAVGTSKRLANGDTLTEIAPAIARALERHGLDPHEVAVATGPARHLDGLPGRVRRALATAHDVAPEWHVRIQAACQRSTDLGISKTINLPRRATPDDVRGAFLLAYDLGCKGVTCFRDGCLDAQFLSAAPVTTLAAGGCPSCP